MFRRFKFRCCHFFAEQYLNLWRLFAHFPVQWTVSECKNPHHLFKKLQVKIVSKQIEITWLSRSEGPQDKKKKSDVWKLPTKCMMWECRFRKQSVVCVRVFVYSRYPLTALLHVPAIEFEEEQRFMNEWSSKVYQPCSGNDKMPNIAFTSRLCSTPSQPSSGLEICRLIGVGHTVY